MIILPSLTVLRIMEKTQLRVLYTYSYKGDPFLMVISDDLRQSPLWPSVGQWSCHYRFF